MGQRWLPLTVSKIAHLSLRLWLLPKLLANKFQVLLVKALLLFAVAGRAFPLDGRSGVAVGLSALVLFIFLLVDDEALSDL